MSTLAAPRDRHLGALLDSYRPGIALPGPFFTDDTLYAAEMEYLFGRHWLFLASEPEIPEGVCIEPRLWPAETEPLSAEIACCDFGR
jgi:hypothetical protein